MTGEYLSEEDKEETRKRQKSIMKDSERNNLDGFDIANKLLKLLGFSKLIGRGIPFIWFKIYCHLGKNPVIELKRYYVDWEVLGDKKSNIIIEKYELVNEKLVKISDIRYLTWKCFHCGKVFMEETKKEDAAEAPCPSCGDYRIALYTGKERWKPKCIGKKRK